MKRTYLLTFLLFTFCFVSSRNTAAQNKVATRLTEDSKVSYSIETPTFYVLLSQEGQITSYAIKAQGDISYDLNNRVDKTGDVEISYDLNNRVDQVGNVEISYDLNNRISKIGAQAISYDLNGRVSQIGNTKISYSIRNNKVSHIGS